MKNFMPVIKGIGSIDWDCVTISVDVPTIIGIHIEIGDEASLGADLYKMEVFNAAWLNLNMRDCSWAWGRARMFMEEFDIDRIKHVVDRLIVDRGTYSFWLQFAERSAPFLVWKFDGIPYLPFLRQN